MRHWRIPVLAAVGMLCAVGATQAEAQSSAPTFKVDAYWIPQLPSDERMGDTPGVAVDAKDNVWIVHRPVSLPGNTTWAMRNPVGGKCCKPAPTVIVLDPNSAKIVKSWGGPGWDHFPAESKEHEHEHGIHIDHDGNVWIIWSSFTNTGTNTINKYTADGKFILQLGTSVMSTDGMDPNKFGRPTQFAENPKTNELYLADGYLNRRIMVFDLTTGKFKRMWGAYGKPPNPGLASGDFSAPYAGSVDNPNFATMHGVAVSSDGLVYAADRLNNRIQVFKGDGSFVKQFVVDAKTLYIGSAWGVAWSPAYANYILVADGQNNQFYVMDRNEGKIAGTYGRDGPYAGQFTFFHQLATDSKGNVYTVEVSGGHRVQKWVRQ